MNVIVITISGTYMWSFVPQIFCIGQPNNDGGRKFVESMISNISLGLLASVQTEIKKNQTK